MRSPYSLGANTDFELDAESEKALKDLPPEMQAIARKGLEALKSGAIPPETHEALAQQGQQALSRPQPAPAGPAAQPPGMSPYGVPGVPQAGPPTQAQAAQGQSGPPPIVQAGPPTQSQDAALNARLAAQKAQVAQTNQRFVEAQAGGSPFMPGATQLPDQKPVTPMSGLSNHQKLVNDLMNRETDTRPQGMSPEEIQKQASAISDIPIVRQAQEGLKGQEDLLNMQRGMKRDPLATANLGPLMALQDHFLGSNMAGSYQAPESAGAQQKRIFDALQKIQTDRQALAGNVVSGIKASKGGTLGDIISTGGKTELYQGAADPAAGPAAARADKNVRALMTGVKGDMTELNQANAATQEAQRMLASGGSVLDTTFRDKFLKAMIGGRVTNYDLMRQSGDSALADRAEQIFNSAAAGTFTPKNRAEYEDALRIIQEANAHEAAARLADWRETGLGALGLPAERVDAAIKVGHGSNFAPIGAATLETSKKKSQAAVPGLYDGSYKLAHPTPEQKQTRLEFLQKKAGQ